MAKVFLTVSGTSVPRVSLNELLDVDTSGGADGYVLTQQADGSFALEQVAQSIFDLSDVVLSGGSVAPGSTLEYIGGQWTNTSPPAPTPVYDELSDLTDTTIATPVDDQFLRYDGNQWVNETVAQYHGRLNSEAETLLDGATDTVELYYTAQADGDGLHEDAQTDTPQSGFDIQRKLYYAEKAQADPDTSGDWTQFTSIADNTTFANAKAALLAYLKERTGGTVPISLKMTWEEVAQAPAFTGLLNESYGSGAEAAYSTRRLNGNYSGDCMTIRRASDGTTTSIGFVDEEIDESAIETFCTGTTCTVQVWRDQSGNGNDATQTTAANQPTIYTGGQLVKEGGRVKIIPNDDGDGFSSIPVDMSGSTVSMFSVVSAEANNSIMVHFGGVLSERIFTATSGSSTADGSYAGLTGGTVYFDGVSQSSMKTRGEIYTQFYQNQTLGSYVGFSSLAGTSINISGNSNFWSMYGMQEIIFYTSDKSTDRTDIEGNIGDYFTQNTPLLDTYSGAAAAYSLRKLRTAYTGDAVEVYNGSSYADIGFNVFGELDTVALADHCGSNDGFVSKWYDQSGNTNTAAQTTTASMPKIYDGTTGVVTENGKPALEFDGSNDKFEISTNISAANNYAITWVQKRTTASGWVFDAATGRFIISNGSNNLYYDGAWKGTAQTSTTHNVNFLSLVSPSSGNYYENGTNTQSGLTYSQIAIGGTTAIGGHNSVTPSNQIDGTLQEFIIFAGDQSSNRTNIEDNINTFYNIY